MNVNSRETIMTYTHLFNSQYQGTSKAKASFNVVSKSYKRVAVTRSKFNMWRP